jgi:ABC-type transport system involved in multi-copper enzyme maturation permease subunit
MTQTLALLLDAYRELNSKKMFWIVLILSLVVVGALAAIGIDDKGISIFVWHIDAPVFNTKVISAATFYKSILFLPVGFKVWLTWAATILALISTASIIPDFISGGSIELTLSKPIGRLRLFLTKYATGLLFVTLQVAVFALGSFLVIGLRGKSWEPMIFISVPLVVLFFSYLFSISVLIGLLTRSTIASILLTGLIWGMIFLVHFGESKVLLTLTVTQQQRIESVRKDLEKKDANIERLKAKIEKEREDPSGGNLQMDEGTLQGAQLLRDNKARRIPELEHDLRIMQTIHTWFHGVKAVLPKTSETMYILEHRLVKMSDLEGLEDAQGNRRGNDVDLGDSDDTRVDPRKIGEEVDKELRSRSLGWILGTSLAFEAVMLGIASWIFCRRDF